ncbi:MAG TPA: hypothetical protein VGP96_04940 [Candidatus Dormibacteraeota bacterium]|nr:hypothetical protein [Candidatus Dormibacteraeota bacterium]
MAASPAGVSRHRSSGAPSPGRPPPAAATASDSVASAATRQRDESPVRTVGR